MYWKMEALTKTGRVITRTVEGAWPDIRGEAAFDELDILGLNPDYIRILQAVFFKHRLSASVLASFFVDFARAQATGLTLGETVDSLREACSNPVLKEALGIIDHSVNDGRSLKEAFENAKCFPKIAVVSLSAAEKSGSVPEVSRILAAYFKFNNDNRKRVITSLIYPSAVFCALTVASVVISTNLVPELSTILPPSAMSGITAKLFLSYAMFMKNYWWMAMALSVLVLAVINYLWHEHREKLAGTIYQVPFIGGALKEMELTNLFLNLYVYQKSGIPILETIDSIYREDKSFINEKLLGIRHKIGQGLSLGEAFRADGFFPSFIWHNLSKGQKTGNLVKYLEELHIFYDQKSKDSIHALVGLINPVLLSMAVAFLGFIVCNFFLPVYKNMAHTAIFR